MDVRCERCNTDYEFDDALVSGRGTRVRCTNCGHSFKVARADEPPDEEFWRVLTGDGRTFVFTSLRALREAIETEQLEPSDHLARGTGSLRPIAQIPELAVYFEPRDPSDAEPREDAREAGMSDMPVALGTAGALGKPRERMLTQPEFPPPPPSPKHFEWTNSEREAAAASVEAPAVPPERAPRSSRSSRSSLPEVVVPRPRRPVGGLAIAGLVLGGAAVVFAVRARERGLSGMAPSVSAIAAASSTAPAPSAALSALDEEVARSAGAARAPAEMTAGGEGAAANDAAATVDQEAAPSAKAADGVERGAAADDEPDDERADDGRAGAGIADAGMSPSAAARRAVARPAARAKGRGLVADAYAAQRRGQYEKARVLYGRALEEHPDDSEALTGLAEISHVRRDLAGARTTYQRVLSINPRYLPALVGLADLDWETGDRDAAMKGYEGIVDRFPQGTYPARVKERLATRAPSAEPTGVAEPLPSKPAASTENGNGE